MQPRESDAPHTARTGGAMRVIVAGASGTCGSANVAAMLSIALTLAGMQNASVEVVHAGATLEGMHTAAAGGASRFMVVTGGTAGRLAAAFAMVKAIETRRPGARIEVLITGHDEVRAHAAYQRVRAASERFLGREVGFAGAITDVDTAPAFFDGSEQADATTRRATRASRAARMWAARLLAECSEDAWPEATHSMN